MKKFVSGVMSVCMIATFSNTFAMNGNPIKPDDRPKIRERFRREADSNPGNSHHPIVYVLKEPTDSDRRIVKVYNVQHLFGISDDENFLKTMIELYGKAQEAVYLADQARVAYKGPETAMDTAISIANSEIESNQRARDRINTLARETGLTYPEALESYLMFVGTEAASKSFGSKYGWKVPAGAVGAVGGACLGFFCAAKLYMGIKGAMYISLGIGGLLGGVAVMGAGLYIANDYIQEQAKKADVIFKIQRMQSVARALKQVGSQIVSESHAVLDSNALIAAIDERRDSSNGTKYEDKWAIWRWWNRDIPVSETWCRFDTITDLVCAPKLRDYTSRDGRNVRTYIAVFSSLMNGEAINYGRLSEYLRDPISFERALNAVAQPVLLVSEVDEESDSD